MAESLPIDDLKPAFAAAGSRVVICAPTGSGKSTRVPLWCGGRVLVVQPRRITCRALAQRVAWSCGETVGAGTGYRVRDERCEGDTTRILFVTPGIAERMVVDGEIRSFDCVVLDEIHERRLDTDLLLALLLHDYAGQLIAMSATMQGDRLAAHMKGRLLVGQGRTYPIDVRHLDPGSPDGAVLPRPEGLEARVEHAIARAASDPGDILVFLPGKAEIARVADALADRASLDVVRLHGDLPLAEQARIFEPSRRRKVVLATNVAETSLTVPGIGVVIDSGLVRRTRYHQGRGYLTLAPVAHDSADQRAGRAGRTGPGVCYRLWHPGAQLASHTPPEIERESLVPLVLSAAACGHRLESLPLLDRPAAHALAAAQEELVALGALAPERPERLTEVGRALFGLPLDPHLGRILIEARASLESSPEAAHDAIALVSALATGRPLHTPRPGRGDAAFERQADAHDEGCDAVALVQAVRTAKTGDDHVNSHVLSEARHIARRLHTLLTLEREPRLSAADGETHSIDRQGLARILLRADPRCAYVPRRHGNRVAWSNGGTEVEMGRDSAVIRLGDKVAAALALETRALGLGARDTRIIITQAMPVPVDWLVQAGIGRERLGEVQLVRGEALAVAERVHAGRVLARRDVCPEGDMARQAIADLYLRGTLFSKQHVVCRERLESHGLAARLQAAGLAPQWSYLTLHAPPDVRDWVLARLQALGVQSGADAKLLSAGDLLPEPLPTEVQTALDQRYPRQLSLADGKYDVSYDLERRQVILSPQHGPIDKRPKVAWLPRFDGFRVCVRIRQRIEVLRG